ncbi:Hypothetical predicted protein [Lecanosticta acicola]|uniref:Uncharacterized protein n=1 Tax=Lecanosticta acicola TaxID=111012 RepID=A0AAI8YZV8_9PEZI|nr:Hypothetical predicted protein [Lecanosticta acicola]
MSDSNNPTLIGGHAQYVKGQAEVIKQNRVRRKQISLSLMYGIEIEQATVGSVTGSAEWQQSGEHDKKAGVDAMKAASANRDPNATGFGKAEELAGKAVGCEGMEEEGKQSKTEQ